ncbi:MAG: hypothetical protein RL291_1898, partial [Pseudomonadota bacterium]
MTKPTDRPTPPDDQTPRRKARVYDLDDARVDSADPTAARTPDPVEPPPHRPTERPASRQATEPTTDPADATSRPDTETYVSRGLRWGTLFLGALASALILSTALWVYNYVRDALAQPGWIGWTTLALVSIAVLALVVIVGRELLGFIRVGRLTTLRKELETARTSGDPKAERKAVETLLSHLENRPDLAAATKRMKDYARDVNDPGALLALADRELLGTIDGMARRAITHS